MINPLVQVSRLRVEVESTREAILKGVDLEVSQGDVLCLVGESGSGKTTLALSLLAYARHGAEFVDGSIVVDSTNLLSLSRTEIRGLRGSTVAYVPQDPGTALNPALTIGEQLTEHLPRGRNAHDRIKEVLEDVGLPTDSEFLRRRPSELSGGQQQRITIAIAIVGDPRLLVLDEPTTGLDVQNQAMVLELVARICDEHQLTAIYVTHDMAVVAQVATHVAVMYQGEIVEIGESDQVLKAPEHPYTRQLIAAVPDVRTPGQARDRPAPEPSTPVPALEVRGLRAAYGSSEVLHGLDFTVEPGRCTALVGESGSGKSTLSRLLIGLHHQPYKGDVLFHGQIVTQSARRRSSEQHRRVQYVFQNPFASLHPRATVRRTLVRARRHFTGESKQAAVAAVEEQLKRVDLAPELIDRYPSELSGGQRQRVAIARALLAEPTLLICDEITSALDVSVQASILELLGRLVSEGLTVLFITHDLGVVRSFADDVVVMQNGHIVEHAPTEQLFTNPRSEYAKMLIEIAPSLKAA